MNNDSPYKFEDRPWLKEWMESTNELEQRQREANQTVELFAKLTCEVGDGVFVAHVHPNSPYKAKITCSGTWTVSGALHITGPTLYACLIQAYMIRQSRRPNG